MIVLNVGGGEDRRLPSIYQGWRQHLLDIDQDVYPDIVCDARNMENSVQPEAYDAVFCSHNLEHFAFHEVPVVLKGFFRVLKPDGKADIVVPSFSKAVRAMYESRLDVHDVWYRTPSGEPITFHDVIFGHGGVMAEGNEYYAHKCAFTSNSLGKLIVEAGFTGCHFWEDNWNLYATAYKGDPPTHPIHPFLLS